MGRLVANARRYGLYRIADTMLTAYGRTRARHYDMNHTVIVASSPRGGSTWLAEIVASLPGRFMLWEPLHPHNNPQCLHYGFGWQNYIQSGTEAPRQDAYLRRLFSGQELTTGTTSSLAFSVRGLCRFQSLVVKFVNANLLLPWIAERYPLKTLVMFRHPCAVVDSQLRHGSWSHLCKQNITIPEGLFDRYPWMSSAFDRLGSIEEVLAFEWALQTIVPWLERQSHWCLVTYEAMKKDDAECRRIFDYLGEEPPGTLDQLLRKPSRTVSQAYRSDTHDQLQGWRARLSTRQIDAILKVTHGLGVEFYTENPEPSYDLLHHSL